MNLRLTPLLLFLFFLSPTRSVSCQETERDFEPVYITVTTLHGVDDFDFEAWKKVEEEYFDKVTSKIDLLIGHEVLFGFFEPGYSEIKVINMIGSWEDISAVNERRFELIEAAWPDEEERKIFFERQNAFYKSQHSDEIYLSADFAKEWPKDRSRSESFTVLMKTSILSDRESFDSYDNYKDYAQKVIQKNPLILGYFPFRHFWGTDSREFVEILVFDSLSSLDESIKKSQEMLQELIKDDLTRERFKKSMFSAIGSQQSELYKNVPSLSK